MLVLCSDGKYYADPCWTYDDHTITPEQLTYRLKRKGNVSWSTARAGITLPIKRDGEDPPEYELGSFTVKGATVAADAVVFKIILTKVPPPPHVFNGWLNDATGYDAGNVMDFAKSKRTRKSRMDPKSVRSDP